MDSLPQAPQPQDGEAFVTGGAYALLFLFGALQGLVGCFQFSHGIGAAAALALAIGITCVLGAAGMNSAAGALVPAIGWLVVSIALTLPTAGGSVIVTSTAAGEWYLYGGSVCAAAGVVVAFLRHGRRRAWTGGPARHVLPRQQGL